MGILPRKFRAHNFMWKNKAVLKSNSQETPQPCLRSKSGFIIIQVEGRFLTFLTFLLHKTQRYIEMWLSWYKMKTSYKAHRYSNKWRPAMNGSRKVTSFHTSKERQRSIQTLSSHKTKRWSFLQRWHSQTKDKPTTVASWKTLDSSSDH